MDNLPAGCAGSEEQDRPAAQELKDEFENAKQATSNVGRNVSDQASATIEGAKAKLQEAARGATEYGQGLFNEQKNNFVQAIHEYCRAADSASEQLRREGHTALASRADTLSSRLRRAAAYLQERQFTELYRDAEQFTRKRPEIVFGMMLATGLMTARFLKASERGKTSNQVPHSESHRYATESTTHMATIEPISRETS